MGQYSSYKDSGFEWIGKIPSHWGLLKSKFLWRESFDTSATGMEDLLSVSQYDGITPANGSRSESLVGYKVVEENNLVINIMLAWMGGLGVSAFNGLVSPAYCVYKLLGNNNPKYMHYLYKTPMYLAEFARHSTGVIPSRWRMYTDDFGQVLTLIPPRKEQDAMVAYLDAATAKIDEAIAQQQRMIDLLNERKKIIINHAVTKGFRPNVKLVETGINWIGSMPEHWRLMQLRYTVTNHDNLRQPITADQRERTNPQYDYYGASGVIDRIDHYNVDDKVLLIGEDGANLVLRNLPLVYKAEGKFWVNNHAHILKPKDNDYEFMALVLEAADYTLFLTGSAQPKLSQSNLNSVKLPIPPIEEQREIVKTIEPLLEKINQSIAQQTRMIEYLEERKQIIINDVVTGKVKVI